MSNLHRRLIATGVLLLGFAAFAWLTRSWMTYTLFFRAIGLVSCAVSAVVGGKAVAVLRGGYPNGQRERARQTLMRSILYFALGAGTFVAAPWIDHLYDRACDRTVRSC